jgi:hypothetical protein
MRIEIPQRANQGEAAHVIAHRLQHSGYANPVFILEQAIELVKSGKAIAKPELEPFR